MSCDFARTLEAPFVLARDLGDGRTEVAAINPLSPKLGIDDAKLHEQAARVAEKLLDALRRLEG